MARKRDTMRLWRMTPGVLVKSYGTTKFASRQLYLINPEGKIDKFWCG